MKKIEILEGNYIYLGEYPQNGTVPEPIKWRVLKNENGVLTVIADAILCNGDFDIKYSEYKPSRVREFLLKEFFPTAFTQEEQSLILETELGDGINDKIYIPAVDDIKDLTREQRIRKITPYSYSKKASGYPVFYKSDKIYQNNGWYWTRTPYKPPYDPKRPNHVWYVIYNGGIEERAVWGDDIGIVPMMRVKV